MEFTANLMEQNRLVLDLSLQRVLDFVPDVILIINQSGSIVFANQQVEALLGYTSTELVNTTLDVLIPERLRDNHSIHIQNFFRAPEIRTMGSGLELPVLKKDGTEFLSEITLGPHKVGEETFVTASIRDVTERKRLIADMTESTIKLRSINRVLRQYLFIASHDFHEPIRNVLSLIEILQRDHKEKLVHPVDHYLSLIYESSERMQGLLRDLLDFSKLGMDRQVQFVGCQRVLEEVLIEIAPIIEKSKATVSYGEFPLVFANEMELKQLFKNLILNAIKFHKENEAPVIDIRSEVIADSYLFKVSDNGIGINKTYHKQIFGLFKRLHGKEEYPGTGVGLALCKKIVEAHYGEIWVESEENEGSSFYFKLPKSIVE